VQVTEVLAIDVGGTSIKAARVRESGQLLSRRSVPTPVAAGPDAVVRAIAELAGALLADGVVGVGLVVPGVVDAARGVVEYATNVGWRDVPLAAVVGASVGVPVVLGKDVHAAALAERALGPARGVADCLIVAVGTGISAVAVSGGTPVRGARGLAGEVGHVSVDPHGELCPCGQRGCAERYASGAAIARRYAARAGVTRSASEVAAVIAADEHAAAVWAEAADALGAVLAACTLAFDPELIVLTGGVACAGAALRDPVAAALAARLTWRPAPAVCVSPLAADAGLHGAALLARLTWAATT
jgi:glucokinase